MLNIVKNTTFPGLLDLLAPPSCRGCKRLGSVLCDCCKNNIISEHKNYCPNCKRLNLTGNCPKCKSLPPTYIISERKDLFSDLIHDYKYNSTRSLAKPFAEILDQIIPNIDGDVSLIPLPTIASHIRARSFDHTYLITKNLAKIRGKSYRVEKLLLRTNNTVQVGADAKTRKIQAKSAYTFNKKFKIDNDTTYLLFDDVWTTGSSMKAALKELRKAGANKIIIAILAVNSL